MKLFKKAALGLALAGLSTTAMAAAYTTMASKMDPWQFEVAGSIVFAETPAVWDWAIYDVGADENGEGIRHSTRGFSPQFGIQIPMYQSKTGCSVSAVANVGYMEIDKIEDISGTNRVELWGKMINYSVGLNGQKPLWGGNYFLGLTGLGGIAQRNYEVSITDSSDYDGVASMSTSTFTSFLGFQIELGKKLSANSQASLFVRYTKMVNNEHNFVGYGVRDEDDNELDTNMVAFNPMRSFINVGLSFVGG